MIKVSACEESERTSIAPAFVMLYPIIPMKIATVIEITTHTLAILLDIFSLFSSLIPIKRRRICGIPKYPSPHARVEAMVSAPYGLAFPVARSCVANIVR